MVKSFESKPYNCELKINKNSLQLRLDQRTVQASAAHSTNQVILSIKYNQHRGCEQVLMFVLLVFSYRFLIRLLPRFLLRNSRGLCEQDKQDLNGKVYEHAASWYQFQDILHQVHSFNDSLIYVSR